MAEPVQRCIAFCYMSEYRGTLQEVVCDFEGTCSGVRATDPDAVLALRCAAVPNPHDAAALVVYQCIAMVFSQPVDLTLDADASLSASLVQASASSPVSAATADALVAVSTAFGERVGQAPVQSSGDWDGVWAGLRALCGTAGEERILDEDDGSTGGYTHGSSPAQSESSLSSSSSG